MNGYSLRSICLDRICQDKKIFIKFLPKNNIYINIQYVKNYTGFYSKLDSFISSII
jgi:hypothetical protein